MSTPGHPKGEHRHAQHEGTPVSRPAWMDRAEAAAQRAQRAFDQRSRRERLLLIAALVAAAALLADTLWLSPALAQWNAARTRHAGASAALQRLNADIAQQATEARAIEEQLRAEVLVWRARVQQGDEALHSAATTLVPATDMPALLDRMLARTGGLRLRSMQSLGRVELAAASAASAPAPVRGPALYRHGVELSVEGPYADLLAWLQALEAMPQKVLWGGLQMKVEEHPQVVLTLRLYTLSLDRSWLEI